ncbi:MAG: CoA pyrophosphatase [Henriciella sp.]|nr:CoA pyrophosphatase [Henriciella sp.]
MSFTTLDDFLTRASDRLDPIEGRGGLSEVGDLDFVDQDALGSIRPAAVLIPVIPRIEGPTALLTQRPDTMASHPGQVAFPGGKVDAADLDEVAAALREAEEEVGVVPQSVELIARSAPYITGTAFRITPVIGVLPADFVPQPDPTEVADVFEAPLDFLFNTANHQTGTAFYKGKHREFTEMPWQGFRIWGVTAGIIRDLYMNLYES